MVKNTIATVKSNWIFWLILFVLFCSFVYILRSVLLPFVAGIIIGYLFDPLATKFEKWGMNRTCATILVLVTVVIIAVPALVLLINVIDNQVSTFINAVPAYMTSLLKKFEPFLARMQEDFPNLNAERVREYLRSNMANNLKVVGKLHKSLISSGMAIMN